MNHFADRGLRHFGALPMIILTILRSHSGTVSSRVRISCSVTSELAFDEVREECCAKFDLYFICENRCLNSSSKTLRTATHDYELPAVNTIFHLFRFASIMSSFTYEHV